eukprot:m.225045 g.225045  ORF g.225045 m.225045 type:complete len:597 (-) comp16604_c0_seq1:186-1976(-)
MADKASELKAELARKRKKLEELRRVRESRGQATETIIHHNAEVDSIVEQIIRGSPDTRAAAEEKHDTPSSPTRAVLTPGRGLITRRNKQKLLSMSISEVRTISIPPTEVVSYAKSIQTDPLPELAREAAAAKGPDAEEEEAEKKRQEAEKKRQEEEKKRRDEERALRAKEQQEEEKPTIMPIEKANDILNSPEFLQFFDRSTKLVERTLNEKYDVAIDYAATDNEEDEGLTSESVRQSAEFYHTHWSANRAVTALDWSPKFPELLAVAYSANDEAPNEPEGVVLVWNTHLKDRPEFIFECQSHVLSCCFSPWQPNVIIGGTYSGQVVLWDNRAKRTPVQRSALTAKTHTHPVYCIDVVGSQNAHNLVTVSTDGRLCSWNLDMLSEPQESVELQCTAQKNAAATCLSFPHGDFNSFAVGSEEGAIYGAVRHGAKAGQVTETFEGHSGPVTAVDFHKVGGEYSHLFLSASTDWTVKLWSYRSKKPIYSFEDASDYVYDVQWSTIHPSLFVSADGNGELDFWNPNSDTEAPVLSVTVGEGRQSVNRIRWSGSGLHLAAGDASGRVFVYDVGEKLAVPRADEAGRLKDTIAEMSQITADS